MTENTDMQRMTPLASIVDQLQDIAREELPAPRTCRVELCDDGDYNIVIYHSQGEDAGQVISYDVTTGDVVWKYRKNGNGSLMRKPKMVKGMERHTFESSRSPKPGGSRRLIHLSNSNESVVGTQSPID